MVEPAIPENSSFEDAAVRCVRLLQDANAPPTVLLNSPENSTLASGLTMMINTARYIENTVRASTNLGNLTLMICAKVDRGDGAAGPANADMPEDSVVLHWGQNEAKRGIVRQMLPPPPQTVQHQHQHRPMPVRQARQPNFDLRSDDSENPDEEQDDKVDDTGVDGPHVMPNGNLGEEISIHPAVAAKCLSLLLDGMGYSSHRTLWEEQNYSKLCRGLLSDPVRQVFNAEKQKRYGGAKRAARMKYDDLPPPHLRGKEVMLPIVRLAKNESDQNYEVMESKKVRLRIAKPLKNRKEVSFGLLCVMLQYSGQNGVCASVLKRYADEGLSSLGCLRKKQASSSSAADCGGPTHCTSLDSVRESCRFFYHDSGVSACVGAGTVDPLCVYLRGECVPPGSYVVRFKTVEVIPRLQHILHEIGKTPVMWKRTDIERIILLGHRGDDIGTAILADGCVMPPITSGPDGRQPRAITMDVSHAVIVCDVQLHGEASSYPYPYSQWYNVASLKRFKFLHFKDNAPPGTLNHHTLENALSLLWHGDRVRRQGPGR